MSGEKSFPRTRDGGPATALRRAVLLALPPRTETDGLAATSCLMPLVDRPLVQHAIERLCGEGIERLDVVGVGADARLQSLVCDPRRWGCEIHWHSARHADDCEPLRRCGGEDRVLLADASALPLHSLADPRLEEGVAAAIVPAAGAEHVGWAALDGQVLEMLPPQCGRRELRQWLELVCESRVTAAEVCFGRTLRQLLGSQRMLLERESDRCGAGEPGDAMLRLIGRQHSPGVRVCRNVRIHRTARLAGPVFVGDNARIGKGVRLGPNTVVGPDCIVDHHAQLSNSLLLAGTYIGPWVELHDSVARRHDVANVRLQARATIDDPLVAGSV